VSPGRSKADNPADELLLQESIMNAICEFANNLPDYQKIEVMMFIISKVVQIFFFVLSIVKFFVLVFDMIL